MDGQVQYVDAHGRVWEFEKRGMRWFARAPGEVTLMDFNLYQLFQQIDKQPK